MSKESVQELPHYAPTSLDSANSGVQDHALQEQIAQLKSQVHDLEGRLIAALDAAHCSEAHAYKRAHKALTQHIQVLVIESKHLSDLVRSFEVVLLTPSTVASEIGSFAAIAATAWGSDRCLRLCRLSSPSHLFAIAALAVLGWRLGRSATHRLANVFGHNRRIKRQLETDWKVVKERIDILSSLSDFSIA